MEWLDSTRRFLDNSDRLLSQEGSLYARIQVRARMNTGFAKSTGNRSGAFLEALLLLFIAVAGQASIAVAQSSGTFAATGSMITPRFFHTATLLPDGRVFARGNTKYVGHPRVPEFAIPQEVS
jgi:hypothetical protein